jgi:diguanylate cyclase (GGDEF)-like protein/PAS domain S-box-containing protein
LPRLLGLLLLGLGLEVMAGWLLQVPVMVEIRRGLVAMVFNTALCFALAGAALVLPGLHRPLRWLPGVIGALLFGLTSLILIEQLYDVSLGIDWAFLHTWLRDGNIRPGRLAPNTAIGFMLAGTCLILLNHITSRRRERIFKVAVFCMLVVGLTGLVGYLLSPDQLFGWARSARMALHTATGMIVLALALWCAGQQQIGVNSHGFLNEEEKISFMSAAVMCVVALMAGLTAFVFQQSILETSQRDKLQFRLNGQLGMIQVALEQGSRLADRVAQDERWHEAARQRVLHHSGLIAASGTWPEFDALLRHGFVSARLSLPDGTLVYATGRAMTAHPDALDLPGSHDRQVALIWDGLLGLRSTLPLANNGQTFAYLILVQAMPVLQSQLFDLRGLGSTGEVMLCGERADPIDPAGRLTCLPSGRRPEVFRVAHDNLAVQPIPVSLALTGKSGLITTLDYRGQNVLAAFAPVAPNLGLAVKQQSAELYGVIRNQLELLIPALLLLLMLGTAVMRWQIRPLVLRLLTSETRAREQRLEINTVLESVGDGILTINEAGIIESFNLAAALIFGYSAQQVIGQSITMLMPEELREAHHSGMQRYLASGRSHVIGRAGLEMIGLHQNGNRFTLELTVNEVRLEARRIFVGVVRDITERKRTEEKLMFLAQYDILTGLPNRALFMDRLSGAILRASRSRSALAVMFLDLDGFKAINDTLGHHSGDDLLRKFAERLSLAVRKSDSVARLAGDEFTVILEGLTQPEIDTRDVAEKIIAAMQQQFELGERQVRVTTSIGLAIHEGGEADLNELLRRADDAMYRAKQRGKNCWCS